MKHTILPLTGRHAREPTPPPLEPVIAFRARLSLPRTLGRAALEIALAAFS